MGGDTYHVKEWKTTEELTDASVMTTGSGGFEEVIPVKKSLTGSLSLFVDPQSIPDIDIGVYLTATLNFGTGVAAYTDLDVLITRVGFTVPADNEMTQDIEFKATGNFLS